MTNLRMHLCSVAITTNLLARWRKTLVFRLLTLVFSKC